MTGIKKNNRNLRMTIDENLITLFKKIYVPMLFDDGKIQVLLVIVIHKKN